MNLKRHDEKNGEKLSYYKKIVRDSLAILRNWQEVKKTYYIHNTRKDQLRLGLSEMYKVDKEANQPELYPKEPYPNNKTFFMSHK